MNRKCIFFIVFLSVSGLLFSQQYVTTTYKKTFIARNIGMWNTNTDFLPGVEENYSISWDESKSIGGFESVLGMDFGAELYGATAGTIGLGYYMTEINGGKIDSIYYPIEVEFMIPRPEDISAGQTIRIPSVVRVNENNGPMIETTWPLEGKAGVKFTFDLETDLGLKVCAFDECLDLNPEKLSDCVSDIMDFKFDKPLLEISTLNQNVQVTVPALGSIPCLEDLDLSFYIPCKGKKSLLGDINYWPTTQPIEFFPLEFGLNRTLKSKHPLSKYAKCIADTSNSISDCVSVGKLSSTIKGRQNLENFLTGSFSLPFIDTLYTTVSRNRLFSAGQDTSISMEFKPLNLIALGKFHDGSFEFPIPCTGGNFYADYMLVKPTMNLDVIAKQDITFDGRVVVSLELPAELSYRVVNKRGVTIQSGLDDVITYEVGNDLLIDYPCNYEYIDFKPTFRVDNKLKNRTYASFNMNGTLQALKMGIGLDKIVVVPAFEICVPNPFGDDWCTPIPEVAFEFDVSVGPLINESISNFMPNPEDLNIELDIFNETWEVTTFEEIPAASFRVAPARFVATVPPATLSCNGDENGSLEVFTQSGTPPFTYAWSDYSTGKKATGLPAGDYYVKVTDKNNCVAMNGATVHEYPALEIVSTNIVHPECYGDLTGSIQCDITGGNPPHTINWSNGGTGATITGIGAGEYTITVTDQNGCTLVESYTVNHPPELTAYVNNTVDVACFGDNTGSINVNASGGVPGYDYFWSNGEISQDIDSLAADTYTLTVVDRNNCRFTLTETINEPENLVAPIEVNQPVSCYRGDDGILFANITGGVAPYDLVWYNPQHTLNYKQPLLSGLSEGVYRIEVYDAHGCYRTDTLYLTAPQDPFQSTLTETHLSCNESQDGKFELEVSGGTPPFSYSWSDGSTSEDRNGLAAGKYEVTITDANQCVTHNNMVLLEPFELTGTFNAKKVSCAGEADGTLEFIPKGGSPPYTYYWDNGDTEQLATGLIAGEHSVTVGDANNCQTVFTYDLEVDGRDCFDIPNAFSPNGDEYNDTWVLKYIKGIYPEHVVRVFTDEGKLLIEWPKGGYIPWDGTWNGTSVPAGTYYYIIDFGDGSSPAKGALTIVR